VSGIAGLLALAGGTADTRTLRRMLAALAHRGADGEGVWASGPVALGHRAFWTTPEAQTEGQPWHDAAGELAVVMDGRIDNRDELRAALRGRGCRLRADHDSELVLRAYECWGENFPRELAGDFGIAVWDGTRRRLVCARDPLGVKPLYYQGNGSTFRWGSEPEAILADPEVPRTADEGMVAEMLAGYLVSRADTLWVGLKRVPPAHTLTVDARGIRLARYWPPESLADIRYACDADYALHFRALLEEAVRGRLRAAGPIASHLSGGIDSSSVVALAQRLLQSGSPPVPLEAFTQTYPAQPRDERAFAEEVASRCGTKWHAVMPDPPGPEYYEAQARRYLDFPDYPNGAAGSLAISRLAASNGCRVMLTGVWGNAFLEGSTAHLADSLRGGRLVEAIRCARSDCALLYDTGLASALFNGGVRPLVPSRIRRALSPLLRRAVVPQFMPAAFARRVGLRDRLRLPEWAPPYPTFAQRGVYTSALTAWNVHAGEITERGAAMFGIEERHPFTDRRLVEFCLALPEEQRWRGTTLKVVLREAMRGLLPEAVRTKAEQPDLSFLSMEALAAAGGERVFENLRIAEQGWVDPGVAREMYRRAVGLLAAGDPRYAELVGPLWTIHGLDLWWRAAAGEGAPCP
jgi:asparagine synthase (glutamine-hydrolysing)